MKLSKNFDPVNPKAGIYDISNKLYHESNAIGSSGLKAIYKTIADYDLFLNKPNERKKAFDIGSCTHLMLLEPDKFKEKVFKAPDVKLSTKDGLIKMIEFTANTFNFRLDDLSVLKMEELRFYYKTLLSSTDLDEIYILPETDYNNVLSMHESVMNHPIAKDLFKDGFSEVSFFTQLENGIMGKAKIDLFQPNGDILVDLKTTKSANPKFFASDFGKLQYHLSLAWYREMMKAHNFNVRQVLIVAVSSTAPFITEVFNINDLIMDEGLECCHSALEALNIYQLNPDAFKGYSTGGLVELDMPAYFFNHTGE